MSSAAISETPCNPPIIRENASAGIAEAYPGGSHTRGSYFDFFEKKCFTTSHRLAAPPIKS